MKRLPRSIRVLLRARKIKRLTLQRLSEDFFNSLVDYYRADGATDDFTRQQANAYAEMCLTLSRVRAEERKIIHLSIKYGLDLLPLFVMVCAAINLTYHHICWCH